MAPLDPDLKIALFTLVGVLVGILATISVARATRKEALRMIAAEKRLEAHQHAFSLWWLMLEKLNDRAEMEPRYFACRTWWHENCLYLDSKSRKALGEDLSTAAIWSDIPMNERKESWKELRGVLEALAQGVELPSLGDHEFKGPKETPVA